MKRALCALLLAAVVSFPALSLPAFASVETEPMNVNIRSEDEDDSGDEDASSEDEDDSSDEDASSGDEDDSGDEDASSEDEDDSGDEDTSSEDEDDGGDEDASSEDEDDGGDEDASSGDEDDGGDEDASSEDEDSKEERAPWWWDEAIDGPWHPGAENTPMADDAALSETVLLQPVIIGDEGLKPNPALARVTAIIGEEALAGELFPGKGEASVCFEAELSEGDLAGTTVSAIRHLDAASAANGSPLSIGDAVYLTLYRDESGTLRGEWSDFYRSPWLTSCLAAIALLLLLCTRRWGGFKLLFALAGGALLAFWAFPALCGAGMNETGAAFLCSLLLAGLICPILYGIKYRTLAACIGSLLSVSIVGGLFALIGPTLRLTGISSLDLLRACYREGAPLHLSAGLTAASMICAAGAVAAACSAAAAGAEPSGGEALSARQAYQRGYRSGSSALAPLTLTFCLFSLGALLPLILPLLSAGFPAGRILSDEQVTAELFRLIAGMLGILAGVPVTSAIAALLLPLRRRADGTLREFYLREAIAARQQKLFGRVAEGIDSATRSLAGKTDAIDGQPPAPGQDAEASPEEGEGAPGQDPPEE